MNPVRAARAARTASPGGDRGSRYTGAPWLESASSSRSPSGPRSVPPNPGACASRASFPGVLYGRTEPVAIAVGERELRAALTTPAGSHVVLDVAVDSGREHSAILKDYQRDKVRGTITHIDLQEVRLDQPIQTAVVVTLVGEPVGVKEGGVLTQVANEVNVEALPLEVPQHIEVDVSELRIGDSLRLAEHRGARGRHVPRRPRGDRARERHAADARRGARGESPRARKRPRPRARSPRPRARLRPKAARKPPAKRSDEG